ncbi:MAG: ABC transporter permease [Myxococcota bacterium]
MSVMAVVRKEVRQLSRDRRTLAVLVLLPAILLLFYGYVLTFDVRNVSLALLDQDQSAMSRRLVSAMTSSEYFERVLVLQGDSEIAPTLNGGRATLVLVIPHGTARALEGGERATLQAVIDGSNANAAQTAQGYAELFVADFASGLLGEGAGPVALPIEPRLRILYNPELESERFLLPGLMAFLLMISSTIATALSIVREREHGTMEQLLVSPLSPVDVVVGKALPYSVVSGLGALIVLVTARIAFGLHIEGRVALLAGGVGVFVIGAEGLGLLISSATASQQVAFQISIFATMLPSLLLSGFIFPIRSMPLFVQGLTFAVPARYFVEALRGIVLKGVGVSVLWPQILALVIFAVLMLLLATRRLRKVRL